jgi:NADPH2:quinone reductase
MRAVQVTEIGKVEVVEVEEPVPAAHEVLVDVHAVGVAFPDLLLSRGEYQLKPEPPFTLGVDFAGTVVSTGSTSQGGFEPGQRVAGVLPYGGAGDRAVVPAQCTFPLPENVSFEQAAAIPMNYLTAHFALTTRGDLKAGETVLVHGAAGGVGTATLQVAKGFGATTIAVVSSEAKGVVARAAGADHVVLLEGFRDEVAALGGADIVLDVVGGDAFTDSLRVLKPLGRLLVVGFAAGAIPEVKVNRLLLNNVDVRGVGWGAYAFLTPTFMHEQWEALTPLLKDGTIMPPLEVREGWGSFAGALADLADRKALGKIVVRVQ